MKALIAPIGGDLSARQRPVDVALAVETRTGRRQASLVEGFRLVPLAAGLWFVLVFAGILWSQHGVDPKFFSSPDEAVDRHAAQLVADHGSPLLRLDQADPENLRHERLWVSVGDHAIPAYPPVAYYLQGAMLKVPVVGVLLIPALSAIAVAALVAGVGLLSRTRQLLAVCAPLLAFPALYWLMRPWINMSTFLSFLCLALFFWAYWLRSRSGKWLVVAAAMVSLAAAIRPDAAPLVMSLTALACLAEGQRNERRKLMIAVAFAGAMSIGLNLALNYATTGKPFSSAYAIWDDQNNVPRPGGSLPAPLSSLTLIFLPYGMPSLTTALDQIQRYWLRLGPVAVLVLGQIALLPLLASQPKKRALSYGAIVVVSVLFLFTHMSPDVFGGDDSAGLLRHSVTRYWTPVYLLASLPPLIYLMRVQRQWLGVAIVVVAATLGGRTIYAGQSESLRSMHTLYADREQQVATWQTEVPSDAVVFSVNLDKLVWSEWETATLPASGDQATAAAAMARIVSEHRPVYIIQVGMPDELVGELQWALGARGLTLVSADGHDDVYQILPAIDVDPAPRAA